MRTTMFSFISELSVWLDACYVCEWVADPTMPLQRAGSLPSTADVSICALGLSEGTLPCKSPSIPCHSLGYSPNVALCPSFQHGYYSKLAKQRRLGGNDGLSSGGHSSVVVTTLSFDTKGPRARSVATIGRVLCPSKANVKWCSH